MPNITKQQAELIREKTQKLFAEVEFKETDEGLQFDVIATTEDTDRDGEVVRGDGIDAKNWFKNPVIIANHWYKVENIVGKGTELYIDDQKRTHLKGIFTTATELGKVCMDLYKAGFLKAVSIGFIVKERDPNDRMTITKCELLEVSFVAVPANPNALSEKQLKSYEKAKELGMIEEEIKNAPTFDLTALGELDEDQVKFASGMLELVSDMIDAKTVAIVKEIDTIREHIKALSDDKDDEQERKAQEIMDNFLKDLSKNVSKSLYLRKQMKSDK